MSPENQITVGILLHNAYDFNEKLSVAKATLFLGFMDITKNKPPPPAGGTSFQKEAGVVASQLFRYHNYGLCSRGACQAPVEKIT
jgi:hypothetical protein